jgi:NAD(P) transhydrogenase subunit alpha
MRVVAPKETLAGERRVALVPDAARALKKAGLELAVQAGAGFAAGVDDAAYEREQIAVEPDAAALLARADVVLKVQPPSDAEIAALRRGSALISFLRPLDDPATAARLAQAGVTSFAMELVPRITRAQAMDALSSQASLAGYRAVLLAGTRMAKVFPMMTTAAGTITAARVLVIGAGVAGLQAIATARRLGAVVEAYDTRPAVKEQIESLGARFVVLDLEAQAAEDKGGYAKAMGEEFYRRQRELLGAVLAEQDVVITTAAVPGKKAPVLITAEMVRRMSPGSVIVDIAAERGGNCEITRAGETVEEAGVRVFGPVNLASSIPYHASQMYARNIATFLKHLIKDGALHLNLEDEIVRETLVTHAGEVVHPQVRQLLATANGSAHVR